MAQEPGDVRWASLRSWPPAQPTPCCVLTPGPLIPRAGKAEDRHQSVSPCPVLQPSLPVDFLLVGQQHPVATKHQPSSSSGKREWPGSRRSLIPDLGSLWLGWWGLGDWYPSPLLTSLVPGATGFPSGPHPPAL